MQSHLKESEAHERDHDDVVGRWEQLTMSCREKGQLMRVKGKIN